MYLSSFSIISDAARSQFFLKISDIANTGIQGHLYEWMQERS